ncbi:hypothetical protein BafACA1_A75 (plasmid) [Borreliella afzelii ACA-1]|nr:hypothetical protein BafACA1_A75 [Borreliella afzelii ACA-1]
MSTFFHNAKPRMQTLYHKNSLNGELNVDLSKIKKGRDYYN